MTVPDPFAATTREARRDANARLRAQAPVFRGPRFDAVCLSRFSDCAIAARAAGPSPVVPELVREDVPAPRWHKELAATGRRDAIDRSAFRERVGERLAVFASRGQFDVHRDLALPALVEWTADRIGLTYADAHALRPSTEVIVHRAPGATGPSAAARLALAEFREHVGDLVAERRRAPVDDGTLLADWVALRPDPGDVEKDDVVDAVFGAFVTGVEVLAVAIANAIGGLDAVAGHAAFEAAPDDVLRELVRLDPPVDASTFALARNVEIGGERLVRGTTAAILRTAAYADPDAFADPSRFDPARSTASLGADFGNPLARDAEALALVRIAVDEIHATTRRYAVGDGTRRVSGEFLHGYDRMPIVFDSTEPRT